MIKDPIVEEVRKARDDYAKKFNYDLDAISRDLQQKQEQSGKKVVLFTAAKRQEIMIQQAGQMLKHYNDKVLEREELQSGQIRRIPSSSIAGKAKIQGDIVNPIVDEEDWECLK